MKNILQNKFFIIILLFIIFLYSFSANCFAFDFTFNNKKYTIDKLTSNFELPKYEEYAYVICSSRTSTYMYIADFDSSKFSNIYMKYSPNIPGYDPIYAWYTKNSNNEESLVCYYAYKFDLKNDTFVYDYRTGMAVNFITYHFSTHDIYDKNNDLVFQKTPQVMITIPEITQVQEIPQLVGKILEILIPIGLIVFSIGFLIYLVRLVISRVT